MREKAHLHTPSDARDDNARRESAAQNYRPGEAECNYTGMRKRKIMNSSPISLSFLPREEEWLNPEKLGLFRAVGRLRNYDLLKFLASN